MLKKFFFVLTSIILSISLLAACSGEEPGFEDQPTDYMDNTDLDGELNTNDGEFDFEDEEDEEEEGA